MSSLEEAAGSSVVLTQVMRTRAGCKGQPDLCFSSLGCLSPGPRRALHRSGMPGHGPPAVVRPHDEGLPCNRGTLSSRFAQVLGGGSTCPTVAGFGASLLQDVNECASNPCTGLEECEDLPFGFRCIVCARHARSPMVAPAIDPAAAWPACVPCRSAQTRTSSTG